MTSLDHPQGNLSSTAQRHRSSRFSLDITLEPSDSKKETCSGPSARREGPNDYGDGKRTTNALVKPHPDEQNLEYQHAEAQRKISKTYGELMYCDGEPIRHVMRDPPRNI